MCFFALISFVISQILGTLVGSYEDTIWVFAGSKESVEFEGNIGRVHSFKGTKSDGGSREVPSGAGEIPGADTAARHARCDECLQCKWKHRPSTTVRDFISRCEISCLCSPDCRYYHFQAIINQHVYICVCMRAVA